MDRPPLSLISRGLRKLPWGTIGMVALIVLVERQIDRGEGASYRSLLAWNGHLARQAAANEATKAKVLFLGDSLIKLGLIPERFDVENGQPSYNLAVLAGEPPGTYFLLRRVLESGGRPEAIVVDFAPNLAHLDPRDGLPVLAEQWDAREALDLALAAPDASFFVSWTCSHYVPSIRYRQPIRERMAASLKAADLAESNRRRSVREEFQVRRHWSLHRGATVLSGPGVSVPLRPELEAAYLHVPFAYHPLNAVYIDRILDLADARNIRVYWLMPACVAETQAKRQALGIDAAIAEFVRLRLARHPRLVVVDAQSAAYPPEFFVDGGHLNRRGALVQTRLLADLLRRSPEGGWVRLARFEDRADDGTLEDFVESSRIAETRSAVWKR